jgi:ATP/maltotriose-dependent transcriptional regulator MalT
MVAACIFAWILAMRGDARRAPSALVNGLAEAQRLGNATFELECLWALGSTEQHADDLGAAALRARAILDRWEGSGVLHYAIPALRWSATAAAEAGEPALAHACTVALAEIAAEVGHNEALAALSHAFGELSLLEGDPHSAASQFGQALDLMRDLDIPFDRAQTQLRAATALMASGSRVAGVEHLKHAYRTARKLGARPLAVRAARELANIGEPLVRRLGHRAAAQAERGGLSGREVEVVRLIAVGRTNQEIGRELFLSTRTVDMHVRNILAKLGCRSRTEATGRAGELGLLVTAS